MPSFTTVHLPDTTLIGVGVPPERLQSQVAALCRRVFASPVAEALPDDAFAVDTVSGGITNLLFKVTVPAITEPLGASALLVRIFGEKTEVLIDREKDNAVFEELSAAGFGPRLYAVFGNGRIEEHIPSRALAPSEMAWRGSATSHPYDYVRLIAGETARMHALPMSDPDKSPLLWRFLDKFYDIASSTSFDASPGASAEEAGKAAALAALDVRRIGRELEWLKSVLPSHKNGHGKALLAAFAAQLAGGVSASSTSVVASAVGGQVGDLAPVPSAGADPVAQARLDAAALVYRVVYAHNDLLSGNVLHVEAPPSSSSPAPAEKTYQDRVLLIDYEYGGYNYCGFDVANHFCEHAGFDFDLDRWYPTQATAEAWYRHYLAKAGIPLPTRATYSGGASAATSSEEDDVTAAFLAELVARTNQFALASHCWWGLWAIVQARHSPIDFDFMSYAGLRFGGYAKHKAAFFADAGEA